MDFNEVKNNGSERADSLLPVQKEESSTYKIIQSLIDNQASTTHGVIDFPDGAFVLGFRTQQKSANGIQDEVFHVIRDQTGFVIELNSEEITINNESYRIKKNAIPPLIDDKWGLIPCQKALEELSYPDNILDNTLKTLNKFLEFQSPYESKIVALWIIATYFTHIFDAFPFIYALGPKESGKSKLFEILALTAFNGKKVKTITEAALADTMDCERVTLLVDQAEKIKPELIGLLADSYKKEGAKRRIIRNVKGMRLVQEYSGYGAKGFASTKPLDDDLSDRCIQFNMLKTTKKLPDISGNECIWPQKRDHYYRFLMFNYNQVKEAYQSIPGNGTRKMELWRPLGAVAQVLGIPQEEQDKIKDAFMRLLSKTQAKLSIHDKALLLTLKEFAEDSIKKNNDHFSKAPKDILDYMEQKKYIEKYDRPRPQWAGKRLNVYNLIEEDGKQKSTKGSKLMNYDFNAGHVLNVISRYIP